MYRPLFGWQLEQSGVRTVEQAAELITEPTGLPLSKSAEQDSDGKLHAVNIGARKGQRRLVHALEFRQP